MKIILKKCLLLVVLLLSYTAAQALDRLSVMLDWLPNPDHAPLFIAQEKGIFTKYGLEVTLIAPADASDAAKMVAVGKADLALTYQPSWLIQRSRGLALQWRANLIDQPLACVVADRSQNIRQLSDLKGKTIGNGSGAVTRVLLTTMLQYHGVSLSQVQLLNVHYNLSQALLSHRVAAISGAMRNVELVELQQLGFPTMAFYPEDNGVPRYAELIFVGREKTSYDRRMVAFVTALREAIAYVKTQPSDAWQLFIRHHPELNTPTNHTIWQATLPYFADRPDHFDSVQNAKLAAFLHVAV